MKYGQVDTVKYGQVDTVQYGQVDIAKYGQVDTVKYGQVDTAKYGQVDTVKYGQVDTEVRPGGHSEVQWWSLYFFLTGSASGLTQIFMTTNITACFSCSKCC